MAGCTGWLMAGLAGRLLARLVGWLLGRLDGWLVCWFSIRLLRWLVWLGLPDGF